MKFLFLVLMMNSAFAFTFEEYSEASKRKDALDTECKTHFTNEKCNDERGYLRVKMQDLAEIPEIKNRILTENRLKAFDHARACCENEKILEKDQAMAFEVSMHKPILEKDRLRVNRKNFCYCRADRRLHAFGKEGAGSFYILNESTDISPEVLAMEKEIFISCFEDVLAFGTYIAKPLPPGKAISVKLKQVTDPQTIFRLELNRAIDVKGVRLTLTGFTKSPGRVVAKIASSDGKAFEAVARSENGGTFLEGFPFGDRHAQISRFEENFITIRVRD